jgi:hypothetical protein
VAKALDVVLELNTTENSVFGLPISVMIILEAVTVVREADAHDADIVDNELVAHKLWVANNDWLENRAWFVLAELLTQDAESA